MGTKVEKSPSDSHLPLDRSVSEHVPSTTSKDLVSSLPSSPDGVITYMGRSIAVGDLFASANTMATDVAPSLPPPPLGKFTRPKMGIPRSQSAGTEDHAPPSSGPLMGRALSPIRRPANRAGSKTSRGHSPTPPSGSSGPTRLSPRRAKSATGGMLFSQRVQLDDETAKAASVPPSMKTRSTSLGATVVSGLFGVGRTTSNEEEERRAKFGMHSDGVKTLEYSKDDVVNIVDDHDEFMRLKQTLKKKGAVTNEVLKQRFHFYVMAKKGRDAGLYANNNNDHTSKSSKSSKRSPKASRRSRRVRRSHSDTEEKQQQVDNQKKEQAQGNGPPLMRRGTTGNIQYSNSRDDDNSCSDNNDN